MRSILFAFVFNLFQIAEQMSALNQQKGATLDEMSKIVQQLTARINAKRTQLAPVLRELRPLRQKFQVRFKLYYILTFVATVRENTQQQTNRSMAL